METLRGIVDAVISLVAMNMPADTRRMCGVIVV